MSENFIFEYMPVYCDLWPPMPDGIGYAPYLGTCNVEWIKDCWVTLPKNYKVFWCGYDGRLYRVWDATKVSSRNGHTWTVSLKEHPIVMIQPADSLYITNQPDVHGKLLKDVENMAKNSAIQVQDTLSQVADENLREPLSLILKLAAERLGIGVNEEWAIEALASKGFKITDLPDRSVTRE